MSVDAHEQETRDDGDRRPHGALRAASQGDIAPAADAEEIGRFVVKEATDGAQHAKLAAVRDIIAHARTGDVNGLADSLEAVFGGASPDDAAMIRRALRKAPPAVPVPRHPDEDLARDWREGGYPYRNLLSRRNYENQKYRL